MIVLAFAAWLSMLGPGTCAATLGNPQLGKSRAMKGADAAGVFPRRVVFDPYGWEDRRNFELGIKPAPPWSGVWCTPSDLVRFPQELIGFERARVVVVPESESDDDEGMGREFTQVARVLWAYQGVDLIAEEIGLYGRAATRAVMRLSSGGGHATMRLFLICQSLGRVAADARRHLNAVCSLATGEPADLKALRERCGDSFAARVSALDPEDGSRAVTWRLGGAVHEVRTR